MDGARGTPSETEPVKIVLERRPRPGAEADFHEWIRELVASASRSPALEGSSVLTTHEGSWIVLLRFRSRDALERWQGSSDGAELLARGERLSVPGEAPVLRTGLETWFTLPGAAVPSRPPAKWKMALVTWLALLPQALLLGSILPKDLLPFVVNVALSTAIPVALLTWFIMPALTKALYGWLYPTPRAG